MKLSYTQLHKEEAILMPSYGYPMFESYSQDDNSKNTMDTEHENDCNQRKMGTFGNLQHLRLHANGLNTGLNAKWAKKYF